MDLGEYDRLRKKVESLKAEAARIEGRRDQILVRLRKEFGFSSLEEAEKGLDDLQKEMEIEEREYEKHLQKFLKKWGDV